MAVGLRCPGEVQEGGKDAGSDGTPNNEGHGSGDFPNCGFFAPTDSPSNLTAIQQVGGGRESRGVEGDLEGVYVDPVMFRLC